MKLIDLSMPIWEGAGYGEVLAMPNLPVRFFEYMTYDWNGLRRTEMKIDDESGSPLMTIWQRAPHSPGPIEAGGRYEYRIDEIPLEKLILWPTAVLDVPGSDESIITAEDIDAAVAGADLRTGDHVLVRTRWASVEKAYELADQYPMLGPAWSYEACIRLGEVMQEVDSSLVMTDTPLIQTATFQGWDWSTGPDRIIPRPKPWPSIEARERLMDLPKLLPTQTERPVMPGFVGRGGYRDLIKSVIAICKGLVNAHLITQKRVRMIILPLLVKDGGAAPCRFVAVEDD